MIAVLDAAFSVVVWLCMKMGLGHGNGDIGMCGQGLGTQGHEMRDVRI